MYLFLTTDMKSQTKWLQSIDTKSKMSVQYLFKSPNKKRLTIWNPRNTGNRIFMQHAGIQHSAVTVPDLTGNQCEQRRLFLAFIIVQHFQQRPYLSFSLSNINQSLHMLSTLYLQSSPPDMIRLLIGFQSTFNTIPSWAFHYVMRYKKKKDEINLK